MENFQQKSCELCPRYCGANRAEGERGVCGAADELVVARAALHFWEEPPISGSAGSGTIFFAHCSLHCVYCQNAPIAAGEAGRAVSVHRLAKMCLELQAQGALNINLVTPTHYAIEIRAAILLARKQGLVVPILWNTSGYETVEAVRDNAGVVEGYLTDFKYADASLATRYSCAADYPEVALAALDEMVAQVGEPVFDEYRGEKRLARGVVVRHLMLPEAFENSERVVRLLHERYGNKIVLSLMNQYTPVLADAASRDNRGAQEALRRCPELAQRVSDGEYDRLLSLADDLGIEDYFWQEGNAAIESFIPSFDLTGV